MDDDDLNTRWAYMTLVRHEILAREEVQHRSDVIEFRERWFPGGLLPPSKASLEEWICQVGEGVASTRPELSKEAFFEEFEFGEPQVSIDVPGTGDEWYGTEDYVRPFSESEVGKQLRALSRELAAEYGWFRSRAAAWLVMEGIVLEEGGIWVRAVDGNGKTRDPSGRKTHDVSHLRIQLSAPIDTPPHRLLAEIERLQKAFEDEYRYPLPVRGRPFQISTLDALRFALRRNDGRPWREVLEEWNDTHPERKFELSEAGVATFGKRIRRAYRSIMGSKLKWLRKSGKLPRT